MQDPSSANKPDRILSIRTGSTLNAFGSKSFPRRHAHAGGSKSSALYANAEEVQGVAEYGRARRFEGGGPPMGSQIEELVCSEPRQQMQTGVATCTEQGDHRFSLGPRH